MSVKLMLELPAGTAVPGESLAGHVTVSDGDGVRGLEVYLALAEWTADYNAVGRTEPAQVLASGPVSGKQRLAFELPVPLDAQPEYRNNCGGLAWEVQVKADVRGPDAVVSQRISVARD